MKLSWKSRKCAPSKSFAGRPAATPGELSRPIRKSRASCALTVLFMATLFANFEETLCQIVKNENFMHMPNKIDSLEIIQTKETWENDNLYLGYSGSLVPDDRNGSETVSYNGTRPILFNTEHRLKRSKRGVAHLYNMIICATGCNPLAYKGYGCYCGFLGSGYTIDGIDRCCKMHDWCYDATECPMFVEYFVPYYWKCYHGYKPICAVEHGKWGSAGSCAQRLCECDRSFAECLRRYPCPTRKAMCTSSPWRLIQNLFMVV